jgi:hypothetical protein
MFPVGYELDSYILFGRNSVLKGSITILDEFLSFPMRSAFPAHILPLIITD